MMLDIKLESLIFKHYARSTLLPILTVEIILLAMYFGINAYNGKQAEMTLKSEVNVVMPRLASQAAESINNHFAHITRQTRYFAEAHVPIFSNPESISIIGEKPIFAKAPNGTTHQTNLTDGSSVFIAATGLNGPREMLIAEKSAALNPLYRHIVRDTANVTAAYLNTPGDLNRLYPFMKNVWEQYPADLNMEDYNFFYLADGKHNPSRSPVWTGVYLDPAGQGWMLSCVAPVYQSDTLEGVVGLDVTVEKIVANTLEMDLPWGASAFLADDNGMILAMSGKVEKLLGLQELKSHVYSAAIAKEQLKPEEFNLFKSSNKALGEGLRNIHRSRASVSELSTHEGPVFVIQSIIPETGWRTFVIVKHADVFYAVERLASVSRIIGFAALGGMLIFYWVFFIFLRNRARRMAAGIAAPVEALTQATTAMGTGVSHPLSISGIREIDQLTDNFNTMSSQLAQRSQDLVEARVSAAMKTKEAELSYTRGLYESASGYLHNVGNAITRMESSLMDFQSVIKSMDRYPEVFKIIRQGGEKGMETLDKLEEILIGKAIPALSKAASSITRVKDSIQSTITHQQSGFIHQSQVPQRIDLSALLEGLYQDFLPQAESRQMTLHAEIPPAIEILGATEPLRQGFENLLKNALEAGKPGGSIHILCQPLPGGAKVTIQDDGSGISSTNLPQLMTAGFSTKPGGHGLGLHSFAVTLAASGGRLTATSPGPGLGTTLTAELYDVQ